MHGFVLLLDVPTREVFPTQPAATLADWHSRLVKEVYRRTFDASPRTLPPPRSYKAFLLRMFRIFQGGGVEVSYVNSDYHSEKTIVRACSGAKVILTSETTPQLSQIERYARLAKSVSPQTLFLVGGRHSVCFPDEVLENCHIDGVVLQEGEIFAHTALTVLQRDKPEALLDLSCVFTTADCSCGHRKKFGAYAGQMDDLPFASYDALPRDGTSLFHPYLIATRGCGCRCNFCCTDTVWSLRRQFSPDRFATEIAHLCHNFGSYTNVLHIADDRPPLSAAHAEAANDILGCFPDFRTFCEMRVDECTRKNIELLRRYRVAQVNVGLESLSSSVMRYIRPNQTFFAVKKSLDRIKRYGADDVVIKGYFMVGLPGENMRSVRETVDGIRELVAEGFLDIPTVRLFKPLPGSTIFEDPEGFDIKLESYQWDEYERYSYPAIHATEALSAKELYALFEWFLAQTCDIMAEYYGYDENGGTSLKSAYYPSSYADYMKKLV